MVTVLLKDRWYNPGLVRAGSQMDAHRVGPGRLGGADAKFPFTVTVLLKDRWYNPRPLHYLPDAPLTCEGDHPSLPG